MKFQRSQKGFTLIELLVVISIIAVLAGFAVPAAMIVKEKGDQLNDLNNGRQIYLGLKLFASDNDGRFPWADYDATTGAPSAAGGAVVSNANTAYQSICPQYIQKRSVFYLGKSGWTVNKPDETAVAAPLVAAGDNAYAYVPGLNDNSNPNFPLVADGFSTTVGAYTNVAATPKGCVWKGKVALVVRVDGGARLEKCNPAFKVIGSPTQPDIFAVGANWIPFVPVNPM